MIDGDLLIFVINERAAEVEQVGLIVVSYAHFIDKLANRFAGLLNLLLVEENGFVVGKKLR